MLVKRMSKVFLESRSNKCVRSVYVLPNTAFLYSLLTAVYLYAQIQGVRTGDKTSHLMSYSKLLVCACSDPGKRGFLWVWACWMWTSRVGSVLDLTCHKCWAETINGTHWKVINLLTGWWDKPFKAVTQVTCQNPWTNLPCKDDSYSGQVHWGLWGRCSVSV